MNGLITPEYQELNGQLHAARPDYGNGGHKHADDVRAMAGAILARTILDYGAGKQTLAATIRDLTVISYDPAIAAISDDPEPADLVVCTDVLEHIEPDCLDAVLDHMRSKTLKACYMTVAMGPAMKKLSDGRNAHLLQHDEAWWLPKLVKRWRMTHFNRAGNIGFMFIGGVK